MGKFLNKYETVSYDRIKAVADRVGAHVFAKVRLADVLPVENSGITSSEFGFALRAHADFLVTNREQEPQFCVEFDGPQHRDDPEQTRRDEVKNRLFERFGMPYLRINARYLADRYRSLDLLTYFVDVWFLSVAFHEAQSAGQVPPDEPFDPTFVLSNGSDRSWPYWLSWNLQMAIRRLHDDGRVADLTPSHWIGVDKRGNLRCIAWLFVNDNGCLFIKTGMREHCFPAVDCSDVLAQIAVYDLYDVLIPVLRGQKTLSLPAQLNKELGFFKSHYEMRSAVSSGPMPG